MSGATKLDAIDALQYHKQPAAYRQAVKDLERDLAEALAALSEMEEGYRLRCNFCRGDLEGCKRTASIPGACRAPKARLLLSKHSKT